MGLTGATVGAGLKASGINFLTGVSMKLVRYGAAGREKPGLIDAEGKLRD